MESHRSWFPVILTGLSVALGVLILAVYNPGEEPVGPTSTRPESDTVTSTDVAPTSDQYQAAVNAVMDAYNANTDAQAAYNALVAIRVPAEYLELHLQLVYVFNDFAQGGQSITALEQILAQYDWLHQPIPQVM